MRSPNLLLSLFALTFACMNLGCNQATQEKASSAGDSAMQSAKKLGAIVKEDATNDQTSMSVKSALMGAKDLDTGHLRVDTKGTEVILRGEVPSADQKHRADSIAKGVLGSGFTLVDQLKVAGASKA